MKKFIPLFLVFLILLLSGYMFAKEKRGADLLIREIEGNAVRGELIAIKQSLLLLLERYTGADVTVDVEDVEVIKIFGKSRALQGGAIGGLLGGLVGFLIGRSQGDEGGFVLISKSQAGGIGAVIGGGIGTLAGVGFGAALKVNSTIQLKGKSKSEIQNILKKLRSKARIKNSQ
jgi:hypothetical protein